jgi:hypothetical protein
VVAKLDRLSRSVVDAGRLLEEARKGGFNIVALDLGLDLSTPTGELVANVLAAVAQWERRMIGVRTSEALQVKIAAAGSHPPGLNACRRRCGAESSGWRLRACLSGRSRTSSTLMGWRRSGDPGTGARSSASCAKRRKGRAGSDSPFAPTARLSGRRRAPVARGAA